MGLSISYAIAKNHVTRRAPEMSAHELAWKWEAQLPQISALAKQTGLLRRLTARLAKAESYESLKRVERDLNKLDGVACPDAELARATQSLTVEVREWLDEEWDRRKHAVDKELRTVFEDAGIPLEARGEDLYRYPLTIRLHPRSDSATLIHAGEQANVRKIALNTERIFNAWDATRALLVKRQTDPDLMADTLHAAHDEVLAVEGRRPGSRVRLPDVHFRAFVQRQTAAVRRDPRKARVKPYPRYQFAWDLGLLLARPDQLLLADGRRIELLDASGSASRGAATSMLVELTDGTTRTLGDVRIV